MYFWRDAGALHWSQRFAFLILAALMLVSAVAYRTVSWYGLERPASRIADGFHEAGKPVTEGPVVASAEAR